MSNATQTFREVKRKANAGERIKIVNACDLRYKNGDEFVVVRSHGVGVYAGECGILNSEYVVLEPIATLPDLFAQFIRDNAGAVRNYLADIDPVESAEPVAEVSEAVPQPAPLTRAKVIEMARERVAELERIGGELFGSLAQGPFRTHFYSVEFHVNRDKRTVTALVRRRGNRKKPDAVGIAKCAPDDVFNADIGKAIAAERALGLTLTDAFVNAPKPEKAVVGSAVVDQLGSGVVTGTSPGRGVLVDGGPDKGGFWTYANGLFGAVVVDDTDAIYTKSDGEAA